MGVVRLGVFRRARMAHDPYMDVVLCETLDDISWKVLLMDHGQGSWLLKDAFLKSGVHFRNVYDWPDGLRVGGYFR
jgi:hypothetical protein